MNEIIQAVMQRVNLPEDKAKSAVEVVVNMLKQRLPGPIAGQIDSVLGGGGSGLGGALGGMLGK